MATTTVPIRTVPRVRPENVLFGLYYPHGGICSGPQRKFSDSPGRPGLGAPPSVPLVAVAARIVLQVQELRRSKPVARAQVAAS